MATKAKNLAKGSIWQTAYFFANLIISICMMPFIIHSLGDKIYGLWILVGTFLGYYWLFDFGLSSAAERYISRAIGSGKREELNIIVNTSLFLYTIGGILVLVVSLILAYFIPLLFVKNITDIVLFRWVLIILGLNFAINFPMRIFSGILRANLLFYQCTAVDFVRLILRNLLIIYVLLNGFGIAGIALITLFTDMGGRFTTVFLAKRAYRDLRLSRRFVLKSRFKEFFSYGGLVFVNNAAHQLRYNVDNFVITIFLGLNFVTLYSIAIRLIRYFQNFIGSALGILMPLFSQYEGKGDYASIRERFVFFTKISVYLSLAVGSILIIFGKLFIQRWMGSQYEYSYTIMLALIFVIIICLMQQPISDLLYGISKHKFSAIVNISEGLANLILSIVLVKKIGLIGVAYGTAIPMFIAQGVIIPIYSCRVIGLSIRKYFLETLFAIFLKSISIIGISYLFYVNFLLPTYSRIIFFAFLHLLIFGIFAFILGFNDKEIEMIKEKLIEKNSFLTTLFNLATIFRKKTLSFVKG